MPVPTRTYEISKSANEKFNVTISAPALKAEGLHLQTWGSSFILANLLHRLTLDLGECADNHPEAFQILELGAGTGLVGLSAALLWGARVMLTDLAPILPGIAGNIDFNWKQLEDRRAKVFCGALNWNTPSSLKLFSSNDIPHGTSLMPDGTNKASIILAADTMYTEEHPAQLSGTIFAWLSKRDSKSRAIVCYPMRTAYLDYMQDFWTRMEEGGMEVVQEGREELDENNDEHPWDDERLHEWSVWKWKHIGESLAS